MIKTKAQLEAEIKERRLELDSQDNREENIKTAASIKDIYDSYVIVGFTEEQAWEIVKAMLANGGR